MADPSVETAPRQEISYRPEDERRRIPDPVWSIGLSGGGYRAMLFHTGALWRLHETGLLARIAIFSSVSGGSIANGWLALTWGALMAPGAKFARRVRARHPRHGQHHGRRVGGARPASGPGPSRSASLPPTTACCSREPGCAPACRAALRLRCLEPADRRALALPPRIHGRLQGRLRATGRTSRCRSRSARRRRSRPSSRR